MDKPIKHKSTIRNDESNQAEDLIKKKNTQTKALKKIC